MARHAEFAAPGSPAPHRRATDAELVRRSLCRDGDAFAQLVDRHAAMVFARVAGRVTTREDAEDVAQDAFCRALALLPSLREPARFSTTLEKH